MNVDDPEADVPTVIGTLMNLSSDRVHVMGNAGESALLKYVGALHDDSW